MIGLATSVPYILCLLQFGSSAPSSAKVLRIQDAAGAGQSVEIPKAFVFAIAKIGKPKSGVKVFTLNLVDGTGAVPLGVTNRQGKAGRGEIKGSFIGLALINSGLGKLAPSAYNWSIKTGCH